MLSLFRKRDAAIRHAVVPLDRGVAFAEVDRRGEARPRLVRCGFVPNGDDAAAALARAVRACGARQAPVSTLLDVGSYNLLLVEMPRVPPEEMRQAVRWQVRDLIDFHIDDAVIDVFDAPASAARGVQDHLYVVAARKALVQERVDALAAAGAKLGVIDIPELALRNLAALLEEDREGVALLYLGDDSGLIALCRQGVLYLARTLALGQVRVSEALAGGDEQLLGSLALEIQRTLDYYDRHFQQAPIGRLAVAPLAFDGAPLTESIQSQLGLQSRMIDLCQTLECETTPDAETASQVTLAVAAALRQETRSL
ncbi:type IV pilus biogenesis protein PilM [Thiohalobacter sp.]|uniref:type IV pilus biogenesis protein PilM n=1 Tax=Thiohalobacter sp. TaxID=2025948 RepID=UPI0026282C09|nr:pilus assembly protein PilM [Thiohalobacter sp.]